MRIIPAIDIINGKAVRLTKGDYNTEKVYNENLKIRKLSKLTQKLENLPSDSLFYDAQIAKKK